MATKMEIKMSFSNIFIYSLLGAFAALVGTAIVLCCEKWSKKNSIYLISFAAGVMLTIAFLNLIPVAASFYPNTWTTVFAGFLGLYILQNIILFHPCHDMECKTHLGIISTIGLSIHSFLDGMIISIGFEAGWSLGFLTTIAVMLHKMPDGITITGILLHSGMQKNKIILLSSMVALFTPLGAIISFFFLKNISHQILGILIALTAGSFLYLAASDLLPETHHAQKKENAAFFFTGIIVIVLIEYLLH